MTAQAGGANISTHIRDMAARERSDIRHRIRAARRRLPAPYRRQAAAALASQIARLPVFRRASLIAGYLPTDGEIDPVPVLQHAIDQGKQLCLPAIDRPMRGAMRFLRYGPDAPLRENRYGILEPIARFSPIVAARELDLVLVPLVAFDAQRNRIGMGGGYYDRHFASRCDRRWRHPALIGVAYELQRLSAIDRQTWDVPLDAIVTDCDVYG